MKQTCNPSHTSNNEKYFIVHCSLFIVIICSTAFIISACTGGEPLEQNYTVPSWTLFKRALQAGKSMTEASFLLV